MHSEEGSRAGLGSGFPVLRRDRMRVVRQPCPQAGIWPQSQGCVAPVGVGGAPHIPEQWGVATLGGPCAGVRGCRRVCRPDARAVGGGRLWAWGLQGSLLAGTRCY